MRSQVWNRFVQALGMVASQCPLLGACHRLAISLGAARRPSSDSTTRQGQAAIPAGHHLITSTRSVRQGASGAQNKERRVAITTLTDSNFSQVVERSKGVALVDFWAPWCMPCRLVGPTIERLAKEFDGRVTVGKLNVDEHMSVAKRFHISGIPTVGIFRDGKLINQMVGVRPEAAYRQALESVLKPAAATGARGASAKTGPARHSVTVFSTPTCPWCTRLKAYLREKRIAFKDVDVSRDTAAAQEMVRRSGEMGVPQAWIDGQVVVGFDRKRVDALLGLSADVA